MSISRKDFLKSLPGIIYLPPFLSSLPEYTKRDNIVDNDFRSSSRLFIKDQSDFEKYKNHTFEKGSLILFARGKVFKGQFSPGGSGSQNEPIKVAAYDPGSGKIYKDYIEDKPVINALGKTSSAFHLLNSSFWDISNLEITNDGNVNKDEKTNWKGIEILAEDAGLIQGITIRNNYIHDVNTGFAGKKRGAIFIDVKGEKIKTRFDQVRIEDNKIENVGGIGISNSSSWGSLGENDYYPWTNIAIRSNQIKHTGRNAIIIRDSINPVVEYNTIGYSSRFDTGNSIFNFNTIGCIMQHNEVYGNTGALTDGDRGGFDADFNSIGTIIQYNYSHDNHWFCSIMRKQNNDVTVRYNISQNDLLGAYFYGFPRAQGLTNLKIYNNTHYFGSDKGTEVFVSAGRTRIPIETHFFNNIFYFTEKGQWSNMPDETCQIENNLFYNFKPKGLNEIIVDPVLTDPGKGGTDIEMHDNNRLSGYRLREVSPAIDSGISVNNNGGQDFGGKPLYNHATDIGACEYQGKVIDSRSQHEI